MKIPESTWSRKFGLSVKKMNSREISERYRLIADYHTHTRYSKGLLVYYHGKGTIEENVAAAAAKGLQEIGITDHGPGHIFYGLNLSLLPDMRRDVAEAKRKYPEVKIQLGVEANIIHSGNGLDVAPEDIEKFDFINAGYHHGVPKGDMIRNPICSTGIFPSGSRQQLENRNTEMALRAIYENPIRILTHPGDKGPFNIKEIGRACEARGTRLEINSRHSHLTAEEIRQTMNFDVTYVVSSDAHKPSQVGGVEAALERAEEAGLDFGRIINIKER